MDNELAELPGWDRVEAALAELREALLQVDEDARTGIMREVGTILGIVAKATKDGRGDSA